MEKTTEQLIEEFLANGGEIEVLPPAEYEDKQVIGSTTKKVPELKTLPEGEFLYGKKQKSRKKKAPDYSGINMDLIPEHLKDILKVDKTNSNTKEEQVETDQNCRSSKASDES